MPAELPTLPVSATTWSPEEALTFVAFLDGLIVAVWSLHGERMAAVLRQRVEEQLGATANRAG
jgi:hypothetical protein